MSKLNDNIKSQMRKGILEYLIMLCLRNQPAYSSDIINALKKGKFIIVEGALYPLLARLKANGLLDYVWVESRQGPPRKYYKLTDEGNLFLTELEDAYMEINEAINYLKNNPIINSTLDNEKVIKNEKDIINQP